MLPTALLPKQAPRDLGGSEALTVCAGGEGVVHSFVRAHVSADGRATLRPFPTRAASLRVLCHSEPSLLVACALFRPPVALGALLQSLVGSPVEVQMTEEDVAAKRWQRAVVVSAAEATAWLQIDSEGAATLARLPLPGLRAPPGCAPLPLAPEVQVDLRSASGAPIVAGERVFEVSYVTDKFSWRVDYSAVIDPSGPTVQFEGTLSVRNDCGMDFGRTQVSLQEPNVPAQSARMHLIPLLVPLPLGRETRVGLCSVSSTARSVILVRAPGPAMAEAPRDILIDKSATPSDQTCTVCKALQFTNGATPLLPGSALLLTRQGPPCGGLEPLGREVPIERCDAMRAVRLRLPVDVAVSAARRRVDFRVDRKDRMLVETFEIVVARTAAPQEDDGCSDTVIVEEDMPRWGCWAVASSNYPRERVSSSEFCAAFVIELPPIPRASATLTYTVAYTGFNVVEEEPVPGSPGVPGTRSRKLSLKKKEK